MALMMERAARGLATQPMMLAGHPVWITISAGIACLRGEQESLETLLERADRALYQAKTAGRNRVDLELTGVPAASSRYQAVSRDISAQGMRILAERTFPANTPIRLAVEDDEHAGDELTFHTGSIVWAHPLPGERSCMLGIQFGECEALQTPA